MRLKSLTALSLFVASIFAAHLSAQEVVVERLPDPALLGSGVMGGNFLDRPGEAVSPLTLVTITEETTITSITTYTTNLNDAFPGVGYPVGQSGPAVLNIFLGSELPFNSDTLSGGLFGTPGAVVDYVATDNGIEITANNLDITLPAAPYLIGITPILNFASNGQEFFLDAGAAGQTTFLNNPGGDFFDPPFDSDTINANELDLPTTYSGMAIRITADAGVLKGDVNGDGFINLLDVAPFVDALTNGIFLPAADVNCDGMVNLLDVSPFVELLSAG